jgi:uncharacterized protein YciI
MQFAIIARDKADSENIRDTLRPRRLQWLTANQGRIIAGGGLVDDRNKHVHGGLMIVDAKDRAEAEQFAAEDPFTGAGLYDEVKVVRWRRVFWNYGRITSPDPFKPD